MIRKKMHAILPFGLALLLGCSGQAFATTIVIDAGHGGSDPGAIGTNGLQEKTVNLDVALRLRDELQNRGYNVVMTRETDEFWTLAKRVSFTDEIHPDAFLSIHSNSYSNPSVQGSMVLYYDKDYPQTDYPASDAMIALSPESKRFAGLTLDALVKEAGTVNKGLDPSAVYVARMGTAPSILVELGFLSNPDEAARLADPAFRSMLARGLASGVQAYKPLTADIPAKPDAAKPDPASPFLDISSEHWAFTSIVRLEQLGIVKGEGERFYPDRAITRAEFVSLLLRQFPMPSGANPLPEPTSVPSTGTTSGDASKPSTAVESVKPPKDLPAAHWAYDDVMKAIGSGILKGYVDGTIHPDQPITRGEAAALIDRVIWPGERQTTSAQPFLDVPKSLWSAASINHLKEKGLIEGRTPQVFEPAARMTRAEMTTILAKLIHG